MSETELFTTYDLNLSAVLVSKGESLEEVRKTQNSKSLFCFKKTRSLESLIERYWRGQLRVEPQELFNSIKNIKNRIYSNY